MLYTAARSPVISFRLFTVLILAVLAISGCGFQLRGSLDLPADISPLYIQTGSTFELAQELKSLAEKNKIVLTDNPALANLQLILVSENRNRRVLSVDSRGRASEYLLSYTVNIRIKHKQAKELPDSVSLSRSLLFDPDTVLAASNESETLYRDMRADAARLILLKLQARSANQAKADDSSVDKSSQSTVETEHQGNSATGTRNSGVQ